jgi:hypothetical protein
VEEVNQKQTFLRCFISIFRGAGTISGEITTKTTDKRRARWALDDAEELIGIPIEQ